MIGFGAYLNNYGAASAKSVTISGTNSFNRNYFQGLLVDSRGAISTDNVTANYNGGAGAYLENSGVGVGGIRAAGTNVFLGDLGDGLDMYSNGTTAVTHITANFNYNDGLYVNSSGKLTITCAAFIGNGTSAVTGCGWETGASVPAVALIGVDLASNYSGGDTHSLGTGITFPARTCTLP